MQTICNAITCSDDLAIISVHNIGNVVPCSDDLGNMGKPFVMQCHALMRWVTFAIQTIGNTVPCSDALGNIFYTNYL